MSGYDDDRLWAGQRPAHRGAVLRAQESWPLTSRIYGALSRPAYPVEQPPAYPKAELCPTPESKSVHIPTPIVRYTNDIPREEYGPIEILVNMLAVWLDGKPSLSLADDTVRKQFGMLRAFCRRYRIVPQSYLIPSQLLSNVQTAQAGSGGFGVVYKGKYTRPDGASVDVAVKIPFGRGFRASRDDRDNSHLGKAFFQEIVLWRRLSQHPRITKMIGVEQRSDGTIGIVSEWMENKSLSHYLSRHTKDTVLNRLQLLLDICEGLQHLHSQQVVHGDIKGENILVDKNGRANLADFGMTTLMHRRHSVNPSTQSNCAGTEGYLAPEVIDPERYGLTYRHVSLPGDIYALGVVMWQVFSKKGKAPYRNSSFGRISEKILQGGRPSRPKHPLAAEWGLNDDMWKLINRCWMEEWEQRPQVGEVLNCVRAALVAFKGSR